jgi:hypothetical protein
MDSLPAREGGEGGAAYLQFVRGAHALLAARGKTMMVWGDALLAEPALLAGVPKDVVVASWDYEVRADYAPLVEPLRAAGLPFIVCPGAWNWRRVFPDLESAERNIRGFTAAGRRAGAMGQVLCTWGDGGEALFSLAWYPVACAAAAAWQDSPGEDPRFPSRFDWWLFRADGHDAADAERLIGRVHRRLREATGLVAEPLFCTLDPFNRVNRNVLALVADVAAPLAQDQQDALEAIARARTGARRNAALLDDLEFAARRIDGLAFRAASSVRARTLYLDALDQAGRDRARARDDLTAIQDLCGDNLNHALAARDAFAALWNRDNRPAGLSRVLAQYDADAQMWLSRIEEFRILRLVVVTGRPLPAATDLGFEP